MIRPARVLQIFVAATTLSLSVLSYSLPTHARKFCVGARPLRIAAVNSFYPSPTRPNPTLFTRSMSSTISEVEAAAIAASTDPAVNPNATTFFDKLVSKQIPANIIFEDDVCMAFRDINPQGPVHFLVIPKDKVGLNRLSNAREDHKELLGHLMYTAQKVARQEGLVPGGFRLVINDGPDGSQSVYHLHIHVIGGRQMTWPPG
jgi:histidine triad (HIT) family protein